MIPSFDYFKVAALVKACQAIYHLRTICSLHLEIRSVFGPINLNLFVVVILLMEVFSRCYLSLVVWELFQ